MKAVFAERLRWFHAALFVLLFAGGPHAEAACVDPASLSNSTVSLTRHFGDDERTGDPTLLGIRGTAWDDGEGFRASAWPRAKSGSAGMRLILINIKSPSSIVLGA